ncbi:MAG: hypothetical protein ABIN89_20060 [Chitinophagaceae bacterium]
MDSDNLHPQNKQAFYHLDICCRYVGEKFGHPNISEWTNGDYIKLSGVLSRQMDVQISANTLKRIFGKLKTTERYYPQKVTRDTLARYAGFVDWDEFMKNHPRPGIDEKVREIIAQTISTPEKPAEQKTVSKKIRWPILLPSVILAILLAWMLNKKDSMNLPVLKGAQLICNNPEGTNPHSAVFKLKLPDDFKGNADNFAINFGDGRTPRKISTSNLLTHYYEIPGRYYPVLMYDNLPLDTVAVYLRTNGWTATANMQSDSVRVYPLPDQNLRKDHSMHVSTEDLFRAGVDTNRTFFVHFVNATPVDVSGDDFELTSVLRTSPARAGVRCSQVNVAIFGESSKHLIKVMKPGCASFNGLQFSENIINGESADLSSLSSDLSKGGTLRLQVRNRTGKLWINGKEIFQATYNIPVGKIYGIEILFSGIGEVKSVLLHDLKTGKSFENEFETKVWLQ